MCVSLIYKLCHWKPVTLKNTQLSLHVYVFASAYFLWLNTSQNRLKSCEKSKKNLHLYVIYMLFIYYIYVLEFCIALLCWT